MSNHNLFFLFVVGVALIGAIFVYEKFIGINSIDGGNNYVNTSELLLSVNCTNATIISDNATKFVADCGNGSVMEYDKIQMIWW